MSTLPFQIPSLYSDLAYADGLLSIEGETLALEIQTKDSIIGLLKSNVKEIHIPIADLADVTFKSKWFTHNLLSFYMQVRRYNNFKIKFKKK